MKNLFLKMVIGFILLTFFINCNNRNIAEKAGPVIKIDKSGGECKNIYFPVLKKAVWRYKINGKSIVTLKIDDVVKEDSSSKIIFTKQDIMGSQKIIINCGQSNIIDGFQMFMPIRPPITSKIRMKIEISERIGFWFPEVNKIKKDFHWNFESNIISKISESSSISSYWLGNAKIVNTDEKVKVPAGIYDNVIKLIYQYNINNIPRTTKDKEKADVFLPRNFVKAPPFELLYYFAPKVGVIKIEGRRENQPVKWELFDLKQN